MKASKMLGIYSTERVETHVNRYKGKELEVHYVINSAKTSKTTLSWNRLGGNACSSLPRNIMVVC